MAALMSKTMGALNEERKPVYPLFQKPLKSFPSQPSKDDISSQSSAIDASRVSESSEKTANKGNKGSKKSWMIESSRTEEGSKTSKIEGSAELLEVDPNNSRRKRRKTVSPNQKSRTDQNHRNHSPTLLQGAGQSSQTEEVDKLQLPSKGFEGINQAQAGYCKEIIACATVSSQAVQPIPADGPGSMNQELLPDSGDKSILPIDCGHSSESTISEPGVGPVESAPVVKTSDSNLDPKNEKPKKLLRWNPKTGTIGSPPIKKQQGRPPGRGKPRKTMVIIIRYGDGDSLPLTAGEKIAAILDGSRREISSSDKVIEISDKKATEAHNGPKPTMKVTGTGPKASPHPFFMSKAVPKSANQQKSSGVPIVIEEGADPAKATKTNVKPGEKTTSELNPKVSVSAFTGFGSSSRILKYPGAVEPAWPWKGMVHVRGDDLGRSKSIELTDPNHQISRSKKSKYQAVGVSSNEDILSMLAEELCLSQIWKDLNNINPDEYVPLPTCLRIPKKHFESGPFLQRRVQAELRTWVPEQDVSDSDEDITATYRATNRTAPKSHPALDKIYSSIANSLSAFDMSQCETQTWTQKYSPSSAIDVLQPGREAMILKEWLQSLTVMTVEGGASDNANSRASSVPRRSGPSKDDVTGKRKRKPKKLDGFVVSSDEEADMDEISEPEDAASPQRSQGILKRTVIRAVNGSTKVKTTNRLPNGLVISGPHGCGKSAAVHAVARELGFEVFEINSSSRRSGRDILEKVGDMTRNHLVQQHPHIQLVPGIVDEDAQRISDALDNDLMSGRQGTMNSFFKSKEPTTSKPKPKKIDADAKKLNINKADAKPKSKPKKQKQSLILFEEVDILYEEDKQFWATLMSLIIQSKRPVIMTCNDESVVPLQALPLHAILRFSPTPVDLATDYMLLIAASEGHLLQREAVKGLYENRNRDLRASITELSFWCQFAVGSTKGGLDWFYPRWPIGKDLDQNGKTIRVVSEGTYKAGMGYLSQDFLESHINFLDIEEETLHEVWNEWSLDAGDLSRIPSLHRWADNIQPLLETRERRQAALAMYDNFADSMSAADLCSAGSFSLDNQVSMDSTLPELTIKTQEDTILSYPLIEAHPAVTFSKTGKDISIFIKSRARKYFQVDQHIQNNLEIPTELDRPSEAHLLALINEQLSTPMPIRRLDFSLAFDPISEPEKTSLHSTESLEASSFDRTLALIAIDLAPYVRSIVSYDAKLQQERARMSNLLSEGGRRGKRMRTTRAAMSALEGGARSTTRKEKYFGPELNPIFVLRTGCPLWLDAMRLEMDEGRLVSGRQSLEGSPSKAGSPDDTDDIQDGAASE